MVSPYFILSVSQSGSSSLCTILNTASNGRCLFEQVPGLHRKSRLSLEGLLATDAFQKTCDSVLHPRIHDAMREKIVYGEASVSFGPFIADVYDQFQSRFVLNLRDGREVAQSLVNWNNRTNGSVYRECFETEGISDAAFEKMQMSYSCSDDLDFSRPRPHPETTTYDQWLSLDRLSMCSYCWSSMVETYLNALDLLPGEDVFTIDYTKSTSDDVLDLARWLGLEGLDVVEVGKRLSQRTGMSGSSNEDNVNQAIWQNWDGGQRRQFELLAGQSMYRTGYWLDHKTRWRPEGYGRFWRDKGADPEWFEWMYNYRRRVHEAVISWIRGRQSSIRSIADIGSGVGAGYRDALVDYEYTGFDCTPSFVEWANANHHVEGHNFELADVVEVGTNRQYDLVMSHGTIDCAYDIEAFLDAMVEASSGWILCTCYRGWFPDLKEHKYQWIAAEGCYYNDLSVIRTCEHLEHLGCKDVQVVPIDTGLQDIPQETWITARVPSEGA